MTPTFSLCVYCGSRPGANPAFADAATQVGRWIGQRGGRLVYGGGCNGLMGIVAQSALDAGGTVLGVIPKALVEKEWANHQCTELIVVDTMHERKRLMAEHSDAFVALPGGIGTFEELFEIWTWRQLGYHDKPVGLLDTLGYYDGLLEFLNSSVQQQFIGEWQMGLMRVAETPEQILPDLIQSAGMAPRDRLDAV
jgi:uncharacterized protein (TIGR00730 family)